MRMCAVAGLYAGGHVPRRVSTEASMWVYVYPGSLYPGVCTKEGVDPAGVCHGVFTQGSVYQGGVDRVGFVPCRCIVSNCVPGRVSTQLGVYHVCVYRGGCVPCGVYPGECVPGRAYT